MSDDIIKRLRDAIAAGPTPGPWSLIPQHGAGPMLARQYVTGKQMQPTGLRLIAHFLQRGNSLPEDKANASLIAAASPDNIVALLDRLEKADEMRDVLLRNGFVECDISACNCGSWHHRYGLPERMREIKEALSEAGHELSNENGRSILRALNALIARLDKAERDCERLREFERSNQTEQEE